ncbi:MAG: SURF1 family protein [Gammaproteobacteria bacterium]|jgi:surfeit locus 1 family protein|nr:SURF1 family protein [Gammaproteobacteria bacterium]
MQIGSRQFSPGLWPTIVTLSLLPLLVYLGFWQLDRAEQKSNLLEQKLERSNNESITSLVSGIDLDSLLWRKAVLSGEFKHSPVFLLDNQVLKNEVGYFVYSPFELSNGNIVLVNRGWTKAGLTRDVIPVIPVSQGIVEITGIIAAAPFSGIVLAEKTDEDLGNGLYRLQRVDLEKLNAKYELKLLSPIIRLDPDSEGGFVRDWRKPGSGKEKNLGYAFQWFAMASALLIIFLAVNLKKTVEDIDGS